MNSFNWKEHSQFAEYVKLLSAISSLSGLFSNNSTPYLHYRILENIFCRSFNATNLSRTDTAFDAEIENVGIGLKTFICPKSSKVEKVAEFNQLSNEIRNFKGMEQARFIANNRNKRIELAKRLYGLNEARYHLVARKEHNLLLFDSDYDCIDLNSLKLGKKLSSSSIEFSDGKNRYTYNLSKSTLFREFVVPRDAHQIQVEIIKDPYEYILKLSSFNHLEHIDKQATAQNSVILPLYGYKKVAGIYKKYVFEKSGLNQWNASGRARNYGEVYIPIPSIIHKNFPKFFPARDLEFKLYIPTGEIFDAKVCQENSKALMTNPNKELSTWLLRNLLQLKEGELATIEKLTELGFDSVLITKISNNAYKIDKAKFDAYENFVATHCPD